VFVHDDYVVGELNHGFQYISEALDLERFTMFTFSPIEQRLDLLCEYVRTGTRDGKPLKDDAVIRQRIAQLVTQAEVARVLGLRFVAKSMAGGAAPTAEASEYKLYATELSKRLANAAMDIAGPGSQLRVKTEDAPMEGRAESTYRYTVIDTIGGGASEIQKNIIARRVLGLRVVHESMKGGAPPTTQSSEYKLFTTELSKRLADASMDICGPGSQLRVRTEEAPLEGRAESTYRYTVIDTIGGGASEIQKNVIARRGLGLPKNF